MDGEATCVVAPPIVSVSRRGLSGRRARYLVGGPGWSGAGPVAVGTGVLPLSLDDPGGESHPRQPGAGDR